MTRGAPIEGLPSLRYPSVSQGELPWVTVDQMAEADRLAVEEFDIGLLQMMENAGAALADVTHGLRNEGAVVVLAGGGNNGGGGLCAARHLVNRGRDVRVVLGSRRLGLAAQHQLGTLQQMGVPLVEDIGGASVVIDALVGYGLEGALRPRAAELAVAAVGRFVISLDFPSGHPHLGRFEPDATVTLALPKRGLEGLPLYLADLGLPAALWGRMGIEIGPVFATGRILRIVS